MWNRVDFCWREEKTQGVYGDNGFTCWSSNLDLNKTAVEYRGTHFL